MYPVLFEIPGLGFPIRSFGVMVVLGFLVGTYWFTRLGLRWAADPEQERRGLDAVPVWILIGVLGGARLMYVTVEVLQGSDVGKSFIAKPERILFLWQGGLVMYGGAFGAILAGWWATRRHGLRTAHVIDLGTLGCFLGLSLGRLGCLLVGDDYGHQVPEEFLHLTFPITIKVPEVLPPHSLFGEANAGHELWATQIWMSVNALVLALIGYAVLRRRRYCGQVALTVLLLYSITRFAIEIFRGDEVRGLWFGSSFSTSQIISAVTGLICLVLLGLNLSRRDATAGPPWRPVPADPLADDQPGGE